MMHKSIEREVSTTKKHFEQEFSHLKHDTVNELAAIASEQASFFEALMRGNKCVCCVFRAIQWRS